MKRESHAFSRSTQGMKWWSTASLAVLFMAGCGGGTLDKSEDKPVMASAQTVETQKVAYGPIKPVKRSKRSGVKPKVASSSFTVNPTEDFNGFNPEIWNNQSSWTECNCSNDEPGPPPKIMTWDPEG